ncbi:Uncharacterized protein DBV15_12163, partial [Temnothorax longispinosus]
SIIILYYLYSLETLLHIHNATVDEWKLLEEFEQDIARQKIESEALVYITGYVGYRFRFSFCHLGLPTAKLQSLDKHHWLSCLSRGNCIYPSDAFQVVAKIMEEEFFKFHGNSFNKESGIFDKVTDRVICRIQNKELLPRPVINCLTRTRTYIRLRNINLKIKEQNILKNEKINRKI